jgi:anti-sigma factor RsiW
MESAHVGPERLAAYLDHELSPTAREEVVAHFAECADCRREMTAMRRLLEERSKRRPWYVTTGPLLVAVAAAIVFVLVPRIRRADDAPAPSIRSAPELTSTDPAQRISMISPADDAVLREGGTVFVWRSVGADATYRLTLQDSTGATVWASSTVDTSVVLPDSVRVAPGEYYWSVAARMPDARSAKTGVHRLHAR